MYLFPLVLLSLHYEESKTKVPCPLLKLLDPSIISMLNDFRLSNDSAISLENGEQQNSAVYYF